MASMPAPPLQPRVDQLPPVDLDRMRTHADAGIVLIAGNGHVRKDIAVPYWLHRQGSAAHAVGFLEPASDGAGFDEVHRIPAATREDPCAGFQAPKPAG